MKPRLASTLLHWYRLNKRSLPWRDQPQVDPYAVWVSEIMLQQTRVEAVIPYYEKWIRLFPTIQSLAIASEQEVLNAWEGLGYYSRARNLHKAARIVVEKHGGQLPRDLDDLQELPGIGRYTLGAIASIALGMNVPALDGNVKRVYARVFDISEPVDRPKGEKILWDLAGQHLPKKEAGEYNQALMDLGATICIPKNPGCLICPWMKVCTARQHGTQHLRPVKSPKKRVPHHIHAAGVIIKQDRVLLAQRPPDGLLGGMWEFPNGRVTGDPRRGLDQVLRAGYGLRLSMNRRSGREVEPLAIVHHGYTHFTVSVYVYRCELASSAKDGRLKWVSLEDLQEYPMGKIDRQVAKLLSVLHEE